MTKTSNGTNGAASSGNGGSREKRDRIILQYYPLVKFIANRIAGRLPNHIEVDDLVNSGIIGLIDAIGKFDPSMKNKFKTYAEFRIKGAILDELRALDWVPRAVRAKASRMGRVKDRLELSLGCPATNAQLADAMEMSVDEVENLHVGVLTGHVISLDEHWRKASDIIGLFFEYDLYLGDESPGPREEFALAELKGLAAKAILDLSNDKDRRVMQLYYLEELTMREIGEVIGVTESRVSQIHARAVERVRRKLLGVMGREGFRTARSVG